VLIFCKF